MAQNQPFAEKIFLNFLNVPPSFQLKSRILGEENNANLTYLSQETKCSVSLRGRGSGFIENGVESNDPLHLFIQHNNFTKLAEARQLAGNLIETIQMDLQAFLQENSQTVQQQQPVKINS